jgi:hypothetical protein
MSFRQCIGTGTVAGVEPAVLLFLSVGLCSFDMRSISLQLMMI